MTTAHYLLNIGNTRTALVSWDRQRRQFSGGVRHFLTPELPGDWHPEAECGNDWQAAVSCVVPAIRAELTAKWGAHLHFISAESYPELDLGGYDSSRIGTDRIANIAAARELWPGQAVVVLDCGTALNSVAVDANGVFRGGVILPGRETALRALSKAAAQLPEFAVTAPHELNPLGNTPEAGIRNGVDLGILGAAEKIIAATRNCPDFSQCAVWFTGGDAPFFVQYLPQACQARLAPVPLTLYGIGLAFDNIIP